MTTSGQTDIVRFDDVGLRYGNNPDTLSDINFALKAGSFSFLTGASGAGKSSLLKLIYLALHPSRGHVHIFEHNVGRLSSKERQILRQRIGVVWQDFGLIKHLNVFENTALPLRVQGKSQSEYKSEVNELLKWVGLGDKLRALPETLSGGEKQRAAIARAVITKPPLLIADEPTGNVDPQMARRLLRLFGEMNRTGTTILIATHSKSLLEEIPARIFRLKEGRLTEQAL